MKTKFGAIIVAGSGKIGGQVASRNRAGSYMRTKVTPVNPNTSYQAEVRNRLSAISTAWRALGAALILAWNNAVGMFQGTDVFGDLKTPSGFNLYQALNNNLLRIGKSVITAPPLPLAVPVIETGVLAAVHAGAVTITFTNDPVVTASSVELYATPALSPGVSFVKSELRRIGLMPAIVAHVATITTIYNAKYGAVGAAGQKLFVMLRQIAWVSGQAGIPVVYSCIIT
jgi:hypothetical protein